MVRVYLKSICVVKTPVFCCFKKAFLDPLKAEEKDQLECKPLQNIEKGNLGKFKSHLAPQNDILFTLSTYFDQYHTCLLFLLDLDFTLQLN